MNGYLYLVFPDGSVNFTSSAAVEHPVWTSPEPEVNEDPATTFASTCRVLPGETCKHRYTLLSDVREATRVSEERRRLRRPA